MHTHRSHGRRLGLAVALLLALAVPALAGTLEEIKKRGTLVAGVKTDFPPFGYVDSSGKNLGFDVDVAHRFAKALLGDESKVELVAVTSGNRIPFLQSGKIDIIIATVTITDERKQVVDFSEPYFLSAACSWFPRPAPFAG
jgi:polar amino acid transport system substrate-binding protein